MIFLQTHFAELQMNIHVSRQNKFLLFVLISLFLSHHFISLLNHMRISVTTEDVSLVRYRYCALNKDNTNEFTFNLFSPVIEKDFQSL